MHSIEEQIKDVPDCLSAACRSLNVVGSNITALLKEIDTTPECVALLLPDIHRLQNEFKSFSVNFEAILIEWEEQQRRQQEELRVAKAGMASTYDDIKELQSKMQALQRERDRANAQLAATQEETARLRSQLANQSAFCASLGSVLGNLLWKASRIPPVVDLLLSGNKVSSFLCIVSGTLESFLEAFNTEMPVPSADESQFIMAMGGIVTNMAAAPVGREFLVSDPNGQDLIRQIIKLLPLVPTPSGNCLKRLLLMALYNVSINQAGLSLLHGEGNWTIFTITTQCLKPESTDELRIMALRLLNSLTSDIKNPVVLSKVPCDLVNKIANCSDPQLQTLAQGVKDNVFKAQEKIKQMSQRKSQSPEIFKDSSPEAERIGDEKRPSEQPTTAWRLSSRQ